MFKKHFLFFHTLFTILLIFLSIFYVYARFKDEHSWSIAPQPFIYFLVPISYALLFYWLIQHKDFYEESIYYAIQPYLSTLLFLSFGYLLVNPNLAILFTFPIWLISIKIYFLTTEVRRSIHVLKSPFSLQTNSFFIITLLHFHQLVEQFFSIYVPIYILLIFILSILYLLIQSIYSKDYILALPFIIFYSSYALTPTITDSLKTVCAFGLGISLFILYTLLKHHVTHSNTSIQLN